MTRLFPALVLVLALMHMACSGGGDYASVSEEVNQLLRKDISLTTEDRARVSELRSQGERLRQEGKEPEALQAMKEARMILHKARDADLLRKSEG